MHRRASFFFLFYKSAVTFLKILLSNKNFPLKIFLATHAHARVFACSQINTAPKVLTFTAPFAVLHADAIFVMVRLEITHRKSIVTATSEDATGSAVPAINA